MTAEQPTEGAPSVRPPGKWKRLWSKAIALGMAGAVLAAGLTLSQDPAPAEALPRGEVVRLPGGEIIANFVLPNGKRAYCLEVSMGEPTGSHASAGRLSTLPGRTNQFPAYSNKVGIRQMNYIIDRFGQSRNANESAATQVAVWTIRSDVEWRQKKRPQLQQSAQGRAIIARANTMIDQARKNAIAPVDPQKVTGKLKLTEDPNGKAGRFRVEFPKGTTKLSAKNGTFVRNGKSTLEIASGGATATDARYIDVKSAGKKLEVRGEWISKGKAGWEPFLQVYNTAAAGGKIGQRVGVATGESTAKTLNGSFGAETIDSPSPPVPPTARSQAQASAEVGGTMQDTLIVEQARAGELSMWPNAVADFTAYLLPEVGETKVDENGDPILGAERERQAEDPETGEALWSAPWWANTDGTPLLDADGNKIPARDAAGNPTSGTAADGTAYPVQELDEDGAPKVNAAGDPVYLTGRDPVMETVRDRVRWTEAELAGMSGSERCIAQPIYREGGIPVPGLGRYSTQAVPVKSAGTVNWVERVVSDGNTVHEGRCGTPSEVTKIGRPTVTTTAQPEGVIGDLITDTAHVQGTLLEDATYEVQFDAFKGTAEHTGTQEAECVAENRIFRSSRVAVTTVGDVQSPGFEVKLDHGETIWWVERLIQTVDGEEKVIHEGECGLPEETTTIGRPSVSTTALEGAIAGDEMYDIAHVDGELAERENAKWEVTFEAFTESYTAEENQSDTVREGEEQVQVPECVADNRVHSTDPVNVTGPGDYRSPGTAAKKEWAGKIWWVETLWLLEDGERIRIHKGECGLPNETTTVTAPTVHSLAQQETPVGGLASDTAIIEGELSTREGVKHEVEFAAYAGDQSLTGTEAAKDSKPELITTTPRQVVDAASEPKELLEDGTPVREVISPEISAPLTEGRVIWWVERLIQTLPDGTEVVLAEGELGLANEATGITVPTVKTEATKHVIVGDKAKDTATITGTLPQRDGVTHHVVFEAYQGIADHTGTDKAECTASTRILVSDPVKVSEKPDRMGGSDDTPIEIREVVSPELTTKVQHGNTIWWVEKLVQEVDGKKTVISTGKCGIPNETTTVENPDEPLAKTGSQGIMLGVIAGILLLAGGAAVAVNAVKRRKEAMAIAASESVAGPESE